MTSARYLPFLALALTAACGDDDGGPIDAPLDGPVDAAPDAGVDAPGFYRDVPATLNRDLDVVFVVDNSGSMLSEQQQLTASFPTLINTLQQIAGGLPNLHIGVLSSNVGSAGQPGVPGCTGNGDDGNFQVGVAGSDCAAQFGLQGSFISDIGQPNGTRDRNYTGELAPLFTCMASLGTNGCGFEQHLESMYRSLQPGKNPGFLRSAANLAIVILADEDDCSTEDGTMFGDPTAGIGSPLGPRTSFRCHEFGVRCDDDPNPRAYGPKTGCRPDPASPYMYEVDRYVSFLRALKAPPAQVVVAGISGFFDPTTGALTVGPDEAGLYPQVQKSCGSNPGDPQDGATPSVRLHDFLAAFPGRNSILTICNGNLDAALLDVGLQIKNAIGNPCIDADLADGDAGMAGLQPSCTVTDVLGDVATPIPACDVILQPAGGCAPGDAGTPCWCLTPDAATCPTTPSNLSLSINRGGAQPPLGTMTRLYCATN